MKKLFIFSKADKETYSLMEESRYNPMFDGREISRHIYDNTRSLDKHLDKLIKKHNYKLGLRVI